MDFTSITFAIFLPVLFLLYWFVLNKSLKAQNLLLLIASYFFYGWWDWRFLLLLLSVSVFNYLIGLKLDDEKSDSRLFWFRSGVVVNILLLCFFKYFNFFIDSFIDLVSITGYELPRSTLRIILPLGISFYTFLSISYLVDIYNGKISAHRKITDVLLTLSFFPIILAGPIHRPALLLPQLTNKRTFEYEYVAKGLKQILWGLFSKMVIADNLASRVDEIFLNYSNSSGLVLILGLLLYSLQIYADFSGYSNIAIGVGSLFGFRLMQNFNYPYFTRDITEFWHAWHISLTTWFRDYVFFPISCFLANNIKQEKILTIRNDYFIYLIVSIITWFLTGLWHGANYTYIVWGIGHGLFLILHHFQKKARKKMLSKFGLSNDQLIIISIERTITLFFVAILWTFFRSDSLTSASAYLTRLFSFSLFYGYPVLDFRTNLLLIITVFFMICEWFGRKQPCAVFSLFNNCAITIRWSFYYLLLFFIIFFSGSEKDFIYLQF